MFRQETLPPGETEAEDHSMRIVEWALAFTALLAAVVLAFIR